MRDSLEHWSVNRYPLIELGMSRQDCLAWMHQHYPDITLTRSACAGCPFRSNEEWVQLKETDRAAFDDAVEIDYLIRTQEHPGELTGTPYMHRAMKPLDLAVKEYERDKAMNPTFMDFNRAFGEECEGLCGV